MLKGLPALLFLSLLFTACGGRIPSDAKTAKLSRSYFQHYGKKYKETTFSQSKVLKAEVKQSQELQKNLATSFVLLQQENGNEIPVIVTLLRKFPTGWRISSWEKIEAAPNIPQANLNPETP